MEPKKEPSGSLDGTAEARKGRPFWAKCESTGPQGNVQDRWQRSTGNVRSSHRQPALGPVGCRRAFGFGRMPVKESFGTHPPATRQPREGEDFGRNLLGVSRVGATFACRGRVKFLHGISDQTAQ